jgi:thiamine-phosphate pyrophosphorylase
MPVPRLYLVTPPTPTEAVLRDLGELLDGFDVACVRIGGGARTEPELRRAADAVRALCHPRDVNTVLTDHYRLAPELGLDGVHLSDGHRHVREARKVLGPDAIVGAYVRNSRHEGMIAAEMGADYVSFGPVSPASLGDGTVAPLEMFRWWSETIETPVVAEGGLTPTLAAELSDSADFLALGEELWLHPKGARKALEALVGGFRSG